MRRLEKVRTGILGFDEILGGGIVRNSVVMLAGHPGSGKTTFGAQFVYNGVLLYDEPGVYVSFAETKEEFYRNMSILGLSFDQLERKKFKFVEALTVTDKKALDIVASLILEAVTEIGAKRLVLDSVSALAATLSEEEVRAFLHTTLMRMVKTMGITTILIADLPFGARTIGYGIEEFIVDGVVILELTSLRGLARRLLRVDKMRGVPTPHSSYEFTITTGGAKVYVPLEPVLTGTLGRKRLTTGIPELDNMLGGGLREGSITLLAGASGTGKTMIALMFILEGVAKGERAVYVSYEEPADQLRTVIEDLGFDSAQLEQKGLKIISESPRHLTSGLHYDFLREICEEFRPSRFVVDGLGALERHYAKEEFLEVARNFALLSKAGRITVLMTTIKDLVKGEVAELSTVADNIIALWFERERDEIKRKIAVLKERGSAHDRRVRYIDFRTGKVVIHD
jgi:circadian clock protein KaiC